MSETIYVHMTGNGTADWRAEFANSHAYICDIRLTISSMLNGSHYYVLHDEGLVKEGTFKFGAWDSDAAREVVEAIMRSMYPDASIIVEAPVRPGMAAGT
jgi:hypothetical protein